MSAIIGTARTRADAAAKATGQAVYTADLAFERAASGVVLRSPHPFARIRAIDVARAQGMPGVVAVVFSGNTPRKPFDFSIKDQHLFPQEYVRYKGEPVAAVAAETEAQAHAAAAAIDVKYEALEPVMTIDDALRDGAQLVHPRWKAYEKSATRFMRGNVCGRNRIRRGDVEKAFERAHVVIDSSFELSHGIPGYVEPRSAAARKEPDGGLTVWCGSQSPYGNREELAEFFDLDVERVRFVNQFVGGAFGGKILMAVEWFVAALALNCERTVRMIWSRHEDGLHVFPRHGGRASFRTGAAQDGTLLGMRASFAFDTGAYLGYGSGTALIATMLASAPYRIPALDLEAKLVYTHKQVAGPVRAPGGPEATYCKELHIDEVARALSVDPLELRLKNAWVDGDESPTGQKLTSVSARETLQKSAAAIGWGEKLPPNRGRGLSCSWWFSSCGRSEAKVEVRSDGSVHVVSGNPEIGTGSAAGALPILVADHLGIDPSQVRLTLADTATRTYDGGVHGSTATFSAGQAVEAAALDVRRQLLASAEESLEARVDDIELSGGFARVRGFPDHAVAFANLAEAAGGTITGEGGAREIEDPEFDPELVQSHDFAAWMAPSFTTSAAEVDVDPQTGCVKVLKIVTAQDAGFAINPTGVVGQIEGGAVQGLGYGLTEELQFDESGIVNTGLKDYLLPTAVDAPAIEAIIVESPSSEGPHGMKGVGEPPVTTPAGAIGNAIRDAVGAVPHKTPMTPERVWRAINAI
ncbi:MAG: hypothetical protein DLM53_08540 [Candidatus Eremiobacter antarcticus]|nr:xanthine dehydrogenase family protein molybdopterin-binding subunit [Candidatus Eremiobacteraeota bacterium]MBC5809124.1 xanthine dehydrogenase family protein molybdopterin-binding subunit [Candidatus Eremiobacteraeota bacterium]PZR61622.1 MAG: hypothetical protein DLM53_08540 [Candidatus Eremiobacter sp. RRmetagenome_bin22]